MKNFNLCCRPLSSKNVKCLCSVISAVRSRDRLGGPRSQRVRCNAISTEDTAAICLRLHCCPSRLSDSNLGSEFFLISFTHLHNKSTCQQPMPRVVILTEVIYILPRAGLMFKLRQLRLLHWIQNPPSKIVLVDTHLKI